MNPFDLRGPQFLLFYLLVGVGVITALVVVRLLRERGPIGVRLHDPYLIGCLRGGIPEVLRLVVVSLCDRGLLERSGDTLTARPGAAARVVDPVERAVLELYESPAPPTAVFGDRAARQAAEPLQQKLERHGLLPDAAVRSARAGRLLLAIVVLLGLSLTKIVIALQRGRSNIGLLIFLTVVFCALAAAAGIRARTVRGEAALADLHRLFARLRGKSPELGPENHHEALFLAAVFGIGALPSSWAYAQGWYARSASSSSGGSSCGSSSSCSSGSSCGGGCGGGGCGGCGS